MIIELPFLASFLVVVLCLVTGVRVIHTLFPDAGKKR
jgi:hypothetical protein